MTLLFFDGFDNVLTMPKPEWDASTLWNTTQPGRDGSTNGAGALGPQGVKILTLPTAAATCVVGVALRVSQIGAYQGNSAGPLSFRTGALTSDSVSFTFDLQGRLQLRTGGYTGTVLATGTTPFPLNAWVHLQAKVTSSATALSVAVYLNGSTTAELTYTGAAGSSQTAAITRVTIGNGMASQIGNAIWFDDLWVCDTVDATATQGRPNNDVLGDLKVTTLLPTGAGASTQWTPTGGTNVAVVSENPPDQTGYVSAATTGLRDIYDTADLPASASAVYGLRVGAYAQKTDAGAANIKPLVRESNGTLDGAATVALSVTWAAIYGTMLTRKADNSLWSVADVNGAQVGIESA